MVLNQRNVEKDLFAAARPTNIIASICTRKLIVEIVSLSQTSNTSKAVCGIWEGMTPMFPFKAVTNKNTVSSYGWE